VRRVADPNARWTLADIGCGTGLATELLLRTPLRDQVSALQMVDTSSEMIGRCQARAAAWGIPVTFIHGQIDKLPNASVDFLVACSVLHHIPNLSTFCREIERVLRPGGFFLHIHDSRPDAEISPECKERVARLAASRNPPGSFQDTLPVRIYRRVFGKVRRLIHGQRVGNYLDDVNQKLIDAGLIKRGLSPQEIWSITDIRVGTLPYAASDGVGIDELAAAMPKSERISIRTYAFFGHAISVLPPEFAAEERRLIESADQSGTFLAGLWRRRD
jgi:SAM-dependent methyltransferase